MLKVFGTQAVISRGFEGAAAIKFSEKGDTARFRIGKKVYDANAEGNARWINISVKVFGPVCERIKKMQLKEGSFVNFIGRLDEDVWEDPQTHEKKSAMVIILDDIEYASSGGKTKENGNSEQASSTVQTTVQASQTQADTTDGNFTGYEPFGSNNAFFSVN